jgi:hypothetical protein
MNRLVLLLAILAATGSEVRAHATGESYVWLNVGESTLHGEFQIRLDDLRTKLGIAMPEEPEAARQRIAETAPEVWAYLQEKFAIFAGGQEITWEPVSTDLQEAEGLGHFARYLYRTPDIDVPDRLTVRYEVLLEHDRFHRGLLLIETNAKTGEQYGGEFTVQVFSPSNTVQELDLTAVEGILKPRDFVWQGMLHIWIGIDHILFLVALLLPAVLVRRDPLTGEQWSRLPRFRSALWNVVKIVTVFTVAHSITLTLAALDIVTLPSRLVESMIALSIIFVAVNNIVPKFHVNTLAVIFFFGLFHGMGFASVMGDLPFRMVDLLKVILAFNIGVELGQIAIVAAIMPLLFWLARSQLYPRMVLVGGSVAICFVAAFWLVERATGLTL